MLSKCLLMGINVSKGFQMFLKWIQMFPNVSQMFPNVSQMFLKCFQRFPNVSVSNVSQMFPNVSSNGSMVPNGSKCQCFQMFLKWFQVSPASCPACPKQGPGYHTNYWNVSRTYASTAHPTSTLTGCSQLTCHYQHSSSHFHVNRLFPIDLPLPANPTYSFIQTKYHSKVQLPPPQKIFQPPFFSPPQSKYPCQQCPLFHNSKT